jgi:hypothetical protein
MHFEKGLRRSPPSSRLREAHEEACLGDDTGGSDLAELKMKVISEGT